VAFVAGQWLALAVSTALPLVAAPTYNVVVITADDLSEQMIGDLTVANLLPHLQSEFINTGMRFTNSFTTTPLCCPSRATLLTGQYAHNHHVRANLRPNGGVTVLDDSSTVATWLADAGYATGFVGKYLNGYGRNSSGSDPSDDPTYIPPGWTDWQALTEPTLNRVYNYQINDNGALINYGSAPADYQTDVLAQRAVAFLTELPGTATHIDAPFFLWIAPLAPHSETMPAPCSLPDQALGLIRPAPRHEGLANSISLPRSPSFNEADLSDKPAWFRQALPTPYSQADIDCLEQSYRSRLASMLAVDDLIGSVTEVLRTRGAMDRTVLIFTSDNGFLFGEHRATGKVVPYEESSRVPLYIRHPAMTSESTTAQVALNTDLAPTIAELAGVTPGIDVDGRSLVPLLEGTPPTAWRDLFLIEGLRLSQDGLTVPTFWTLRSGPFALVPSRVLTSWQDGSAEYYDLNLDPFELASNAAVLTPGQRGWANTRINQLRSCAGQACRDLETW